MNAQPRAVLSRLRLQSAISATRCNVFCPRGVIFSSSNRNCMGSAPHLSATSSRKTSATNLFAMSPMPRSGPHPGILRNLTGILIGNIVARELDTPHQLIVPAVTFAKENGVFSQQHAVARQTLVVGDQLARRVEAAAQIVRRNRAEMAVMDIVLARPHHLYRPPRTFRHEHVIDYKFLSVIAAPSESAAKQRIVELYLLSRNIERSRRRGLSRRRKLRPAPNFGGVAGGRHRCDRVQRLHLRVIRVVIAILRFDPGRGRRQRGFRITLLVPFNSRLLEITGIGSERVQTFVAVESQSLSAAPPGHPGFKRGLGDKRSPRSFCEDSYRIGQTLGIDDASDL